MTQDTDRSLAEQISHTFPDRHPFPVKCLLWLVFVKVQKFPRNLIVPLARKMGWEQMTSELDIGGGLVFVQQGWYDTTGLGIITGVEP